MRKHRSIEERFWAKVRKTDGCWEWMAHRRAGGYGVIGTHPRGKNDTAHRVSWRIHHGEIPHGMRVCHHCDNPPCVRPDHLFLGTDMDNRRDSTNKLRHNYGSRNGRAKLNEKSVAEIRRRYACGEFQQALADEYGVHVHIVYLAIHRRTWKHVP